MEKSENLLGIDDWAFPSNRRKEQLGIHKYRNGVGFGYRNGPDILVIGIGRSERERERWWG